MEPDYYYDMFNRSRGYTGKNSKGLTAEEEAIEAIKKQEPCEADECLDDCFDVGFIKYVRDIV